MKPGTLFVAVGLLFAPLGTAFGHCDGLDGPVVQAAEKALATGDLNLVLIWVQPSDEGAIREAFNRTLAVRKLSPEARELADHGFFETLVRVHRAGEGATFSGLKPAGRDLGPAIPAADKALREKSPETLIKMLTTTIKDGVREHYAAALQKQIFASDDLVAGRAFVKAYVEYIHCVEALYQQATRVAHGHFDETAETSVHNNEKHP